MGGAIRQVKSIGIAKMKRTYAVLIVFSSPRAWGGVAGGGEAGAWPIAFEIFIKCLFGNCNFGPGWGVP